MQTQTTDQTAKELAHAREALARGQRIIDHLVKDGQRLRRENSDLRRQLHQLQKEAGD